ncbi:hypothetical protein [Chachezhania sediminis]|uniref:hypothetical protein n=1 Tax=Chachezhania sediminis TaxID=2599291 RepID=UPI00131D34CC|nr:hypothetical protein [Chachezhania sediminis]
MKKPNDKKTYSTLDEMMAAIATLPDIQRMRIGEAVLLLIAEGKEVTLDSIMEELLLAAAGDRSSTGAVDHAAREAWALISGSRD